jgi:hypothetical protein
MGLRSLTTAVFCALSWNVAQAATIRFAAVLAGPGEVPPNATTGTGKATVTVNTVSRIIRYTVTYSGLTGPPVAAHFYGPASRGQNAPPIITIKSLASPMRGNAALTDGQIGDLLGGMWYFNIDTAAHPVGEVRGQLLQSP